MRKLKTYLPKFNTMDYVFLLASVAVILFVYIFFRREVRITTAVFKVTDPEPLYMKANPNSEYTLAFHVGDKDTNELGQVSAEIDGIESYSVGQNEQVVYVTMKLKAVYNPRKKLYTLKGKPLIAGESFIFNLTDVKFRGLVIEPPGARNISFDKKVKVRTQIRYDSRYYSDTFGVPTYISEQIKVGDKMLNSKEEMLIEVLNVETRPAHRTVITSNGQILTAQDSDLVDVFLDLEIKAKEADGDLYMFDYRPLKVGEIIPLNLSTVFVYPTILSIDR